LELLVLVYGDQQHVEQAAVAKKSIATLLRGAAAAAPALERHALLVRAFIRAGELGQGIADADFEARGDDGRSDAQDQCVALLVALAKLVDQSWRGCADGAAALLERTTEQLAALASPPVIRVKHAEGFAHYALYPETYLDAARRSNLGPKTRVIGIRSIGLCLAALVSAALNAPPPVSVRPVGHPFRRRITATPELSAELSRDAAFNFAIVDEGPGLSGSSFAAVAEWLEVIGVAQRRIHFFPGHGNGPGLEAGPSVRERWSRARQHHTGVDEPAAGGCGVLGRIEQGVAALIGPLDTPMQDISGGNWRRLSYAVGQPCPPCDPRLERRKFLVRTRGERWLVKFAGLDGNGALKLDRSRALARAGLCPEPAGLCYGFLVERWVQGITLDRAEFPREALVARLGQYLGFRAREFGMDKPGATVPELIGMACCNAREALGDPAAAALAARLRGAEALDAKIVAVHADSRLHAWEWLVTHDGRLLKTDAVDHSCGHDLIGCQDIAWDVAGAAMEHSLSANETRRVCDGIAEVSGRSVNRDLLSTLTPCYLAFQLSLWTMAAASGNRRKRDGQRSSAERYRQLLAQWIDAGTIGPS
jgi:hypothetical protein